MSKSIFSKQLRIRRAAEGISAQEIANRIGVSIITYYNYEQGRCTPSLKRFEKLATALGCTTVDLLSPTININLADL